MCTSNFGAVVLALHNNELIFSRFWKLLWLKMFESALDTRFVPHTSQAQYRVDAVLCSIATITSTNTSQAHWRISDPSWDELLWCTFVKAREIRFESLRVENSCLSWWRKGKGLQRCRGGKRLIVWYCCGRLPWISLQCAWQGSDSRLHKVPAETVEKL